MKKVFAVIFTFALLITVSSAIEFTDIAQNPLSTYIQTAAQMEIINGYADGSFAPDANVTRAQFTAMINRALGISGCSTVTFCDVTDDKWFYDDVEKALSIGYMKGTSSTLFSPNANVKRVEVATIFARLSGTRETSGYTDTDSSADWMRSGMSYAWESGIFDMFIPRDGNFNPNQPMTRAQCAAVIVEYVKKLDKYPIFLTYCPDSDSALDKNGYSYVYVNIFAKDLFSELLDSLTDEDNIDISDSKESEELYKKLEKLLNITITPTGITCNSKAVLELSDDCAYIAIKLESAVNETSNLDISIEAPDKYAIQADFSKLSRHFTSTVKRIPAAKNAAMDEDGGKLLLVWDRDERLMSYSITLFASNDKKGERMAVYSGDIVIIGNRLCADLSELAKLMDVSSGTTLDAIISAKPVDANKYGARYTAVNYSIK